MQSLQEHLCFRVMPFLGLPQYTTPVIDRSGADRSIAAAMFADKVAFWCTQGSRPHVSTDGYKPYDTAIPSAFDLFIIHQHNSEIARGLFRIHSPWECGQARGWAS